MKKSIFIVMALCAVTNGCHPGGGGRGHDHGEEAVAGSQSHDGLIHISPERQEQLGIRVDTVSLGAFSEVIRTSGQLVSAPGDEMTVVAGSEGVVSLGALAEGSPVGKGGRIAVLSTRNIGSGDKLAKAEVNLETARKEYERDLQLREDNIVSESHLDQSRQAYEYARAEYDALAAGGTAAGGIVVASPLAGFIRRLYVRNGDYVEAGAPVATVGANRRLRLKADVPETYFDRVASIRDATFTPAYGSRTYVVSALGGRIVSYGRASEGDFYIPVTFEFDNKDGLVAGSYVDVCLRTSAAEDCISVPLEAVVEDQGVHYVFVRDADGDCFEKREVALGQSDGIRVPVRKGLRPGETVVVSGAVHVKLAGVTSVPAGHTHSH